MTGIHRIFRKGRKTAATISGLILASALIAGLMISCKEESSKPTAPSIPVGPDWQTSENSNEMGFYSGKGDGQFGAFVNDSSEFQISVPAGDFLLTYVVNGATYYVAFRATEAAILHIGLHQGARVSKASIKKGRITSESQKKWQSNDVTLFAWPDGPAWNSVFESDGSAAITLIDNQQVAPDVVTLPEPQPAQNPQPAANPTQPVIMPTVTPIDTVSKPAESIELLDPTISTGVVVRTKDQEGGFVLGGEKDSEGHLKTVTDIVSIPDQGNQNNSLYTHLDYNQKEMTISSPNGQFAKVQNLDRTAKTATVTEGQDGQITNQYYDVPVDTSFLDLMDGTVLGWQQEFKASMKTTISLPSAVGAPFGIDRIFDRMAKQVNADITAEDQRILDRFSIIGALRDACDDWGEAIINGGNGWWKSSIDLFNSISNAFRPTPTPAPTVTPTPTSYCLLGICQNGVSKAYNVAISGQTCNSGDCRSISQAHNINFTVNQNHFEGELSVRESLGYFVGDVDSESLDQKNLKGTWKIPGFDKCGNEGFSSGTFSGTQKGGNVVLKLTGDWAMESDNCASHFTWPFTGMAKFTVSQQ